MSGGWAAFPIRPPVRLCQATFFVAIVVAFTVAVWPDPLSYEGANTDKFQHFAAFYVLEMLALAAFRTRLVSPALGLVALGALIEIVQGMIGRDRSLWDLLADTLGVSAAMIPLMAAALRRPAVKS